MRRSTERRFSMKEGRNVRLVPGNGSLRRWTLSLDEPLVQPPGGTFRKTPFTRG